MPSEIKDLKSMKLHISLDKDSEGLHGLKHEPPDNSGCRFTHYILILTLNFLDQIKTLKYPSNNP
jgi:hypothetical protein